MNEALTRLGLDAEEGYRLLVMDRLEERYAWAIEHIADVQRRLDFLGAVPAIRIRSALQLKENAGMTHPMTTTTFTLDGYRVTRNLGVVRGITVRSRSIFGTIGGSLQTLVGGNITLFTELCEKTRNEAFDMMLAHARDIGANARRRRPLRRDGGDAGRHRGALLRHGRDRGLRGHGAASPAAALSRTATRALRPSRPASRGRAPSS